GAGGGQALTGDRQLRLGEGQREGGVQSHHLAGRAHLRPEHGGHSASLVGAEALEREHRLLDCDRRVVGQSGADALGREPCPAPPSSAPSPSAGRSPPRRGAATAQPAIRRAAACASGAPVALATTGTVREARGLASSTYSTPWESAYWMFSRPRTPTPSAMARVEVRIRSSTASERVTGGRVQAESPEWMPASAMCSMTPPRYSSVPS